MSRGLCCTLVGLALAWMSMAAPGGATVSSLEEKILSRTSDESTTKSAQKADESSEIPLGSATDNAQTSEALTQMLRRCADQYKHAESFVARGTYIEALRRSGRQTQDVARIALYYRRPDRLAIDLRDKELAGSLVADGTTVTMLWPEEKQYLQVPQPSSLAAFSDDERAGELLEDQSNSLMRSLVGALLITDDPLSWLYANVDEFIYEGIEEIHGHRVWRVKFLQSNPTMVVTNWMDVDSGFLRKVAIIQAVDENAKFIQSYRKSSIGIMRLSIYDTISTAPEDVPDSAFRVELGAGWKVHKRETAAASSRSRESAWTRLLRAAAAQTSAAGSVTLKPELGGARLSQGWYYAAQEKVVAVADASDVFSSAAVAIVTQSGTLIALGADGKPMARLSVNASARTLTVLGGKQPMALVGSESGRLHAYSLEGKQLWSYTRPDEVVSVIASVPPGMNEARLYVGFGGSTGLYTLNTEGQVLYASHRVSELTDIGAGQIVPLGWSIVASGDEGKLGIFSPQGKMVRRLSLDESLSRVAIDPNDSQAPIVGLRSSSRRDDVVLRRVRSDGTVAWSVGVGQTAGKTEASALAIVCSAPAQDQPSSDTLSAQHACPQDRSSIVVLLGDGRLSLFSREGVPLWRGRITPSEQVVAEEGSPFTREMALADLDHDGTQEIYVITDTGLLQVRTEPGK